MDLLNEILEHLSLSVKKDDLTKKAVILAGMSAYSNNPLNLFLKGESGIGKTYNAVQALKYFPRKDVWMLGALSPTALAHDFGILEDENNNEIESYLDDEGNTCYRYEESMEEITKEKFKIIMRTAHYAIDLRWKILLFLEAPSYETYVRLRPVLSHDDDEIVYKFTDKTSKGSFSVRTAVLRHWPATIFCTSDSKWMQDMVTRSLSISPDESEEKFKEAGDVIADKYMIWKKNDKKLEELREKVEFVLSKLKSNSPPSLFIPFARKLRDNFPLRAGGDMRALDHFLSLIQNSALINIYDRPVLKKIEGVIPSDWPTAVFATFEDYKRFHEIFLEFAESSRVGIPRKALYLFNKIIAGKGTLSPEQMSTEAKKLGINRTARQISIYELRHLRDAGFIREVSDSEDKRKKSWEAVGEVEVVEDIRKSNLQGYLCSFSQFDAQNYLIKLVAEIGIPDMQEFVDAGGLVTNMVDIRHQQGKLLLSLGPDSTLLSDSTFRNYLVFPDSDSDELNKPEDSRKTKTQQISTNSENSPSHINKPTVEEKLAESEKTSRENIPNIKKIPPDEKHYRWNCIGCGIAIFNAEDVAKHKTDCMAYQEVKGKE